MFFNNSAEVGVERKFYLLSLLLLQHKPHRSLYDTCVWSQDRRMLFNLWRFWWNFLIGFLHYQAESSAKYCYWVMYNFSAIFNYIMLMFCCTSCKCFSFFLLYQLTHLVSVAQSRTTIQLTVIFQLHRHPFPVALPFCWTPS